MNRAQLSRQFHLLASPKRFYQISASIQRLSAWIAWCCLGYGIFAALFCVPADYQQGEVFRILYIHVPSAMLSLFIYGFLSVCAFIFLVWHIKLAGLMLEVGLSIGAWFTFLALVTGSIWGKPTWGTWWIWDARLTSELILLFLYLGAIALAQALQGRRNQIKAVAILILVGAVDLPIIHYSVYWWQTLHQGSSLRLFEKSTIDPAMLWPLLSMIVGFMAYFSWLLLMKARYELLIRSVQSTWIQTVSET